MLTPVSVRFHDYFSDLARVEKKQNLTNFDIPELKVMIHMTFNNVTLCKMNIKMVIIKV